jgi:hypothetical protein
MLAYRIPRRELEGDSWRVRHLDAQHDRGPIRAAGPAEQGYAAPICRSKVSRLK